MTESIATVVFDVADLDALLSELFSRLEAFDSFERVPNSVRSALEECFAGRGFHFTYSDARSAANARERLIKVRLGGDLDRALSTLRAVQADRV